MRIALGSAMVVLTALFTGCVIDAPGGGTDDDPIEPMADGIVEVSWFVGTAGCEVNEVDTIQLQMGSFDETFECSLGKTRIQITPGDYELVATGLDSDGMPRFEGRDPLVSVFSDETTILEPLRLSALPASLTVQWRFENGSLCGANDVATIDVDLLSNEELVDEATAACAPGETVFPELSSGTYTIGLIALSQEGLPLFQATDEVTLERGGETERELVLTELPQ